MFSIGQRVLFNDKEYESDLNGNKATIQAIDFYNEIDPRYAICFDEIPETIHAVGKYVIYCPAKCLEAIEDEPIKKDEPTKQEVTHTVEAKTEEVRYTKLSIEEIAIELVKAWGSQEGATGFGSFINNYKIALRELEELK